MYLTDRCERLTSRATPHESPIGRSPTRWGPRTVYSFRNPTLIERHGQGQQYRHRAAGPTCCHHALEMVEVTSLLRRRST